MTRLSIERLANNPARQLACTVEKLRVGVATSTAAPGAWVQSSPGADRGSGSCVTGHSTRFPLTVACCACGACVRGHGPGIRARVAGYACSAALRHGWGMPDPCSRCPPFKTRSARDHRRLTDPPAGQGCPAARPHGRRAKRGPGATASRVRDEARPTRAPPAPPTRPRAAAPPRRHRCGRRPARPRAARSDTGRPGPR